MFFWQWKMEASGCIIWVLGSLKVTTPLSEGEKNQPWRRFNEQDLDISATC
jgi:hypothetical protein